MLKLPIYIYETGYTLFSDLDGAVTQGYTPMYQMRIDVFKGVQNTVKFTVKNQDQKPIDISNSTFELNMINKDTGSVVISKPLTVVDDGSTRATKGVLTLTLTESDTASLVSKFYHYNIVQTTNNVNKPLYVDTHYGCDGEIELKDCGSPFSASNEVSSFNPLTRNFYEAGGQNITDYASSAINSQPEYKRSQALHTIQYYATGYDGTLDIQGSLNVEANDTEWATIKTISLSNYSGNTYSNFKGVYNWIRFRHTPSNSNTGTLDKVLLRS